MFIVLILMLAFVLIAYMLTGSQTKEKVKGIICVLSLTVILLILFTSNGLSKTLFKSEWTEEELEIAMAKMREETATKQEILSSLRSGEKINFEDCE